MENLLYISLFVAGIGYLIRRDIIKQKKKREEEKKKKLEEEIEEAKQQKLKKEINDLADSIIRDWNGAIYADKIETPGNRTVIYKFENGDTVFYRGDTLKYTTSKREVIYTIGLLYRSKFTKILNRMVEIINEGNTSTRKSKSNFSGSYKHTSTYTSSSNNNKSPRQRRYDIIVETIKLRKEKLAKMSKNDPERNILENELRAAERKAEEIKNK